LSFYVDCRAAINFDLGKLKGNRNGKVFAKNILGPPGCGKSFHVREVALGLNVGKTLEDLKASPNMIETAFHPEYGYGDFVAKLLPKTKKDGGIEYCIHAGPLIKALARAYANPDQSVLLVIDEINRGNCAQIFGDIFQLLDRNDEGCSEYGINPSDLIMEALMTEMERLKETPERNQELTKLEKALKHLPATPTDVESDHFKFRLPPNLFLIGTMNTSDESVYYMDTAFKRRWNFEYMPWNGMSKASQLQDNDKIELQKKAKIENTEHIWHEYLEKLNNFIAAEFKGRNVDDKQVGIWFLKASNPTCQTVSVKSLETEPYAGRLPALLLNLEALVHKPKRNDWAKFFPDASVYDGPFVGKDKPGNLDCMSIKKILKKEYQIDCDDSVFERDPAALASHLTSWIKKNINAENVGCISEIVQEVAVIGDFVVDHADIKNKLMFFLWDNVFSRDRKPLHDLLKKVDPEVKKPHTFGEFSEKVADFIEGVMVWDKEAQIQ
jgi:hypothetical protein